MRTWQEIVDAATNNTDPRAEHGADVEVFAEAFGLSFYGYSESFDQDMRKVWVVSWTCTDTRVGIAVYLLNREPVAVSLQFCRKCKEDLHFISEEAGRKIFDRVVEEIWEDCSPGVPLDLTAFAPACGEDQQSYKSLI